METDKAVLKQQHQQQPFHVHYKGQPVSQNRQLTTSGFFWIKIHCPQSTTTRLLLIRISERGQSSRL